MDPKENPAFKQGFDDVGGSIDTNPNAAPSGPVTPEYITDGDGVNLTDGDLNPLE